MAGSDLRRRARLAWGALSFDGLSAGISQREAAGRGWGQVLLAAVMIGLGIRGFYYGDFASVWQRIPIEHLPARQFFAYACAAVQLATGIGLLVTRVAARSSCILSIYLLL